MKIKPVSSLYSSVAYTVEVRNTVAVKKPAPKNRAFRVEDNPAAPVMPVLPRSIAVQDGVLLCEMSLLEDDGVSVIHGIERTVLRSISQSLELIDPELLPFLFLITPANAKDVALTLDRLVRGDLEARIAPAFAEPGLMINGRI